MLNIQGVPSADSCMRLTRRTMIQAAGSGLLGIHLNRMIAAESQAAKVTGIRPRAKSVIFLFLFGGPSQLETFDMKPDAPEKIRGPFKPISSRNPELRISEHLPHLAMRADRFSVIRTLTHNFNDHSGAGHYIQTGKRWQVPIGGGFSATPQDWPSMGAVTQWHSDQHSVNSSGLPTAAVIPNWLGRLQDAGQYRRPGEYAGWLGQAYRPLTTQIDKRNLQDNPYWRDCSDAELNFGIDGLDDSGGLQIDRLDRRMSLLEQFDRARQQNDRNGQARNFDAIRSKAYDLAASTKVRDALNLQNEKPQLRDAYGRHLFGQSCLMARRLVESGVRFVTVHYDCCDGYGWDSHVHSDDVKSHLLPTFDQAASALLDDLENRGLLDETLVVALGEMGRTPAPTPRWGRGHWSYLFPALIAGAGTKKGFILGKSDKNAEHIVDRPVTPEDLAATIYHSLGIDPETLLTDPLNRPVRLVDGGKVVHELFA
ncbi:MAG: hypothetical protein RJA81_1417 [Planctomycetota bacterium]|jgi:hypothetical protein